MQNRPDFFELQPRYYASASKSSQGDLPEKSKDF